MALPFTPSLDCPSPNVGAFQGVQRVGVDDENAQLLVTFFQPIILPRQNYLLQASSYVLTGGQRLFPRILKAELVSAGLSPPEAEGKVRLTLDSAGDFSIYTLTVSGPDIDPFFSSHKLRFRLACDDRFDCRPETIAPPAAPEIPVVIDYLAKDYSSFRQALLEFIPTRLPSWTERSEADIGMMILELMAATADSLSYMQDRVASEAFISSATQRRSVANHLALLGYQMDQGAAAFTWIQFEVSTALTIPAGMVVQVSNNPQREADQLLIFETLGEGRLFPLHNEMQLATFGNADCCLPATALDAVLEKNFPDLRAGDYILFDNGTGGRDIVRLTAPPDLIPSTSPPSSPPGFLTRIQWSAATPLSRDYCASTTRLKGNLMVATHGETTQESPRPLAAEQQLPRVRVRLQNAPLAYLDAATEALVQPSLTSEIAENTATPLTRTSRSVSTLRVVLDGEPWTEVPSLLESRGDEASFRVEIGDEGDATLVFGDNTFGMRPGPKAVLTPKYRVGGGTIGNLAVDTIGKLRTALPGVVSVTNPVPATGGRNPETRDRARRIAPATFEKPLVAVTTGDYETAAQEFRDGAGQARIQRANASFRWTGSWLTVLLAVDPKATEVLDRDLRTQFLQYLETRRVAGYDLEVVGAVFVPLDLSIEFCLAPGFLAGDVTRQLQDTFSARLLPGGRKGFFHPDNFTFGDRVFTSRIYAAAAAIPGVESVQIVRLARLHAPQPDDETQTNLKRGYLAVSPDQIIRLDNDRNEPENGSLLIRPKGKAT